MKKYFSFFLAICLLCISGCNTPSTDEGDDTTEEKVTEVVLVDNGASEYTIIYESRNSVTDEVAYRFADLLKKATGVKFIPQKDTFSEPAEDAREIVIGNTDRLQISGIDPEKFVGDAYIIRVEGLRIFIFAATKEGYEAAFGRLFADSLGITDLDNVELNGEAVMKLPENYKVDSAPSLTLEADRTLSGDSYKVSGEDKKVHNYCTVRGVLKYTFDDAIGNGFNYFSIAYSSTATLRGSITYMCAGKSITDTVYLEAGNNNVFNAFAYSALEGSVCVGIASFELVSLDSDEYTFRLEDVTVKSRDIPSTETVYISDARYKLGIKLVWGGGISYLEDLTDGDEALGNLLNEHDTGRLVQQSYYGTNEAPYECGNYNGTVWGYNPVQGGDLHGNHSRLIDYKISPDGKSIYIKCQPLDWAKDRSWTPSYMENTYSLEDGYVKVDNRFVDFSGYTHKSRHQELPAFYTISYLSDFVCYLGNKAWNGGELTVKTDLPFWGGNQDAYFNLNSSESWCVWRAPSGFGVGVYTPIAEILLAGRHNYNGSKDSKNDGTNYVAPLITYKLESFEPFEYSYYISTGSTEDIRKTFRDIAR